MALRLLGLNNIKIEQLSEKLFMNLKNLKYLFLHNNRIKHFPSKLLVNNLKLESFIAEENPGNISNIDISRTPNVKFAWP
jgi:Leucine-rich repeat (LRR) protein